MAFRVAPNPSAGKSQGDWRRRLLPASFVLSGLIFASCAAPQARSLPGPVTVDVRMSEYRFQYDPGPLRRGRTLFQAKNTGQLPHQIVMVILPPDTPPIIEQLKSPDKKVVAQLASFPPKPPGATAAFAVDLEPGRYAIVCFVSDADGSQHGVKGMASEFRIK